MRCKVKVEAVTHTLSGVSVKFAPVTSGSEENKSFFKYTPYGSIELGIINPDVTDGLVPGDEYYVDFIKSL
jgi:hypothetical protein